MGRVRSGRMMWDVDEQHIKFKWIRGRVDEASVGQFCPLYKVVKGNIMELSGNYGGI